MSINKSSFLSKPAGAETAHAQPLRTQPARQPLFSADSSIQHVGQNADHSSQSKGLWKSFKDFIKTIFDRIVAILRGIFCKNDQISDGRISADGQYTTHGYERVRRGIDRIELNYAEFRQVYPYKKGYPIIVPRLDFFQSVNYSKDELEWIKLFTVHCISIERRPPWDSYEYSFLNKHIYAYVDLIMKLNDKDRVKIINGILNIAKEQATRGTQSSACNPGIEFLATLDELSRRSGASQHFKEFRFSIRPELNQFVSTLSLW